MSAGRDERRIRVLDMQIVRGLSWVLFEQISGEPAADDPSVLEFDSTPTPHTPASQRLTRGNGITSNHVALGNGAAHNALSIL